VPDEPANTLGHLAGGLIGESDREDGVGRYIFLANKPGDAVRNNTGFTRARTCQDEQGALGGFNGCALFWIQIVEEGLQGVESSFRVGGDFLWLSCSSVTFGRAARAGTGRVSRDPFDPE
jgi:hypothetical protein